MRGPPFFISKSSRTPPSSHFTSPPSPPLPPPLLHRQWHYFFLTETGIAYLKEYLHLPEDIVPATLRRGAGDALEGLKGDLGAPKGRFGDRPDRGDRPPRREGGGEYRTSAAPPA